jgi:hypothetical protein
MNYSSGSQKMYFNWLRLENHCTNFAYCWNYCTVVILLPKREELKHFGNDSSEPSNYYFQFICYNYSTCIADLVQAKQRHCSNFGMDLGVSNKKVCLQQANILFFKQNQKSLRNPMIFLNVFTHAGLLICLCCICTLSLYTFIAISSNIVIKS